MIFPSLYNTEGTLSDSRKLINSGGSILIDILVALSLGSLFMAMIAVSSGQARGIFERAQVRESLLDSYEAGHFTRTTKKYGNEMLETDIMVSSSTVALPNNSNSSIINFTKTEILPDLIADLGKVAGISLCSVDFSSGSISTSYTIITPLNLSISPTLPLTDLEVRNGIAYISADSSRSSDPDIIIINIHDESNPVILSTLNTGPGISSLALFGNRIFSAVTSTVNQLQIIRLNSLNDPILESSYKLPLPYATATPALGSAIAVRGDYVYLGTEKWDGDEFSIIDVSNPLLPNKISGLETGNKINNITLYDGYVGQNPTGHFAYFAGANINQLGLINIDNPKNPSLQKIFTPSGWSRQEGQTVSIFEDNLNLGRTVGGFDIANDHELFSWASSSILNLNSPDSLNIPGGVYGIIRDRNNIFVATRQVGKEFQIFGSNSTSTTDISLSTSTIQYFTLAFQPQSMTCDGEHLYILAHNAPYIYDITFK